MGCAGAEQHAGATPGPPTVYAASSLREALPALDPAARYSFAGSDQLRLQIERGAPADVFVSASAKDAEALRRAGRCAEPRVFASNRLVMLVPKGDPAGVKSVDGLRRGRLRLAIGGAGVPIGEYTREVLRRLGLTRSLERHRVSDEANVAGITAKVGSGSADAGFAYVTDARAAGDRVGVIAIPASAQPPVRYAACAVRRAGARTAAATRYLDLLTGAAGQKVLARFGFGRP
jgi:molybdate transport system substrate-binding protein